MTKNGVSPTVLIIDATRARAHEVECSLRALEMLQSLAYHCVEETEAVQFLKAASAKNTLPGVILISAQLISLTALTKGLREYCTDCELFFWSAKTGLASNRQSTLQLLLKGLLWKIVDLHDPALPEQIVAAIQSTSKRLQVRASLKRANAQLRSYRHIDPVRRLEEIEKQFAFHLELTNRIQDISGAREIMVATSDLLGNFLKASRIIYYEAGEGASRYLRTYEWLNTYQSTFQPDPEKYEPIHSELLPTLLAGNPIAIDDVLTHVYTLEHIPAYAGTDVRAILFVPLVRAGQLIAILSLHHAQPFHWNAEIIRLVKDTAEHTWIVVEKARTQVALEAQRNQIQYIFDSMTEGFAVIGADWRMLDINTEGSRIGQRSRAEVIGRDHWEIWPEVIGTDIETQYRVTMATRVPVTIEQRVDFSNGSSLWLELRLHPILDGGMAVFYRDISQRKYVEAALQESERKAVLAAKEAESERRLLDALLDAIPVGIGMADNNGKVIRHNRANKDLWGEYHQSWSVDDYSRWKGWWADGAEHHGQRLEAHEWALARALKGEYTAQDIVQIETFDVPPQYRTIALSAGPVRDANGHIVGGVVAQTDVTQQIAAEAALRESEAKFRTMTSAMPQMIWSTLRDGSRDYFNRQWYEFTGLPMDSIDGKGWSSLIHPEDSERVLGLWSHSLVTGEHFEVEYRLRHNSGNFRWVIARAVPVTDDDGVTTRWMGSCTDIHDQKLAQEALRTADRRKDEFLAMLAHELRNPLAPINSAADILRLMNTGSEDVKRTSEIISRQVKHMTGLVDDLLDVSRVTRGLIELQNGVINVGDIIADAIEQVQPIIESRQQHLSVNIEQEPVFVTGDRKRLIQVVTNILNNAARYTHEQGNIDMHLEVKIDQVCLHVKDNGIGMTEHTVNQVFDLFAQAERSSDRSQGGLGIGLALVKSLVDLHGGQVYAHSPGIGMGSEFTVTLPRAIEEATMSTTDLQNTPPERSKTLRVLIVDDNADAAEALGMLLELSGYISMIENTANACIERARREAPDVFLLDIGLPDMDGNDLARYLRQQPETKTSLLIAVTGYGQNEDLQKTTAAGFDHHFIKPVDTQSLVHLLDDMNVRKGK